MKIKLHIKKIWIFARKLMANQRSTREIYRPSYRVVRIEQDETGAYCAVIQVIGKSTTFIVKPENLLMNDKMVNSFSPSDIRNLTYLGYLDMNAPKYKILAQKLSEEHDQTVFALLKKGEKNYSMVTAAQISTSQEILQGLNQIDAHRIGFIAAAEQISFDEKQKVELNLLN